MVIYYLTKYHYEYIFKSDLLNMVNQSTERSETTMKNWFNKPAYLKGLFIGILCGLIYYFSK